MHYVTITIILLKESYEIYFKENFPTDLQNTNYTTQSTSTTSLNENTVFRSTTTLIEEITYNQYKTAFSLNNITTEQRNNLLTSSYDMSACITNCSNNGQCVFALNKFKCDCNFPFYTGDNCEIDLRPCSNIACLNQGNCINNNKTLDQIINNKTLINGSIGDSFKCLCIYPYTGRQCELKINVCENETCSGNGYCFDNSSQPTCQCFMNYLGDKCSTMTRQLKIIKQVTSVTAVLAIVILSLFGVVFLAMDISSFSSKSLKVKKRQIKQDISSEKKTKVKHIYKN